MIRKVRKIFAAFMIVIGSFIGNFTPLIQTVSAAIGSSTSHTIKVKDSGDTDCRRTLEGEASYDIDLPDRVPLDLVVVQDASGSFVDDIGKVREAMASFVGSKDFMAGDRIMLNTYQGGKTYTHFDSDGNPSTSSAGGIAVSLNSSTLFDKDQTAAFNTAYTSFTVDGATPTALGIQNAVTQYNAIKGTDTNRRTFFLLITDGIANTRLDSTIHIRKGLTGRDEGYQDYVGAINEVNDQINAVRAQNYGFISGYFVGDQSSRYSGSYTHEKPTENTTSKASWAAVKGYAEAGMSTYSDYYLSSAVVGDFATKLSAVLAEVSAQLPATTSTIDVDSRFTIQSAQAYKADGTVIDGATIDLSGGKINVTTPQDYEGTVNVKYTLKENAAITETTNVASGIVVQGNETQPLATVSVEANPNATECTISDITIDKKINETATHKYLTDSDLYDSFTYNVTGNMGSPTRNWSSAALLDNVNELLEVTDVKVLLEGVDVTSEGTLSDFTTSNNIQYDFAKRDGRYQYLQNKNYEMIITTNVRKGTSRESLAPYVSSGIPNQASVKFVLDGKEGGEDSDIVPVYPPTKDSVIHKNVSATATSGEEQELQLENYDDSFFWNISGVIGYDTHDLASLKLVDEFDSNLVINADDIKISVDGVELSHDNLTLVDNVMTYNFADVDGFNYLAGKNYEVQVKATLTPGMTPQYWNDIANIPNQAQLIATDKDGQDTVEKSEVPVVIPPRLVEEAPVITKDVNGQPELELAQRDQMFNWNINVDFNNGPAFWNDLVLTDNIDSRLTFDANTIKVYDKNNVNVTDAWNIDRDGHILTVTFKDNDNLNSLINQGIRVEIPAQINADISDADYDNAVNNGITNTAVLTVDGKDYDSDKPVVYPPTTEPTVDKVIEGKDLHEITNLNETFKWTISGNFGGGKTDWSKVIIEDQVNELLDIVSVTVKAGSQEFDVDVADIKDNNLVVEMPEVDGNLNYLQNQDYEIHVTTKFKEGLTLEELWNELDDLDVTMVENIAHLEINGEGKLSTSPVHVVPPTIDPEIKKVINGEHTEFDLTNRNENFTWDIVAKFGNGADKWTNASIKDDILDILNVDADTVTVTDQEGKDVKGNGTLTVTHNEEKGVYELVFELDTETKLNGQTYTISVPTSIKASVTDAELAPYLTTGIENKATLNFGSDGQLISNTAVVTPPTPQPEVPEVPEIPDPDTDPEEEVVLGDSDVVGGLPQTNEMSSDTYILIGLALILIGLAIGFMIRRNRKAD